MKSHVNGIFSLEIIGVTPYLYLKTKHDLVYIVGKIKMKSHARETWAHANNSFLYHWQFAPLFTSLSLLIISHVYTRERKRPFTIYQLLSRYTSGFNAYRIPYSPRYLYRI